MTLFCGLFRAGETVTPPSDGEIRALEGSLTRRALSGAQRRVGPGFAVAWLDAGVFEGGVERRSGGGLTLLAGDPILGGIPRSRAADLDRLHGDWSRGDINGLQAARGSFCSVHIDLAGRQLWMTTDKLGLRPIYYAILGTTVIFASALRVLQATGLVPNEGDLRGLAETAAFGFPLGPRSVNRHIRSLEPAEILHMQPQGARSQIYWRWDHVRPVEASVDAACVELRDVFAEAVQLRMTTGGRAVSLLSGGLDSRSVVAQLRASGAAVHTVGFGAAGSADQVLARAASAKLGTTHFELLHGTTDFWSRQAAAHTKWREESGGFITGPAAWQLWSGEGGDRVLAPVNLVEEIVEAMRGGSPDAAVQRYMRFEHAGLPRRLFRKSVREKMLALPASGIEEELTRTAPADPARRFHLYVLLNESRRNIKRNYEDMDVAPIEVIMPFYDSRFVETALKYPLDAFLRHRFYYRWLDYLPGAIGKVPWQAYPVSEPCPLPLPAGIRSQWQSDYYSRAEKALQRAESLKSARSIMRTRDFPAWLLDRPVLTVAWLLMEMGDHRYDYMFNAAQSFIACPPARGELGR